MSIVIPFQGNIIADGHYFSGKIPEIPFSPDFATEITNENRRTFLQEALQTHYPDVASGTIKIIGSLWDYDDPRAEEGRSETMAGHYRVKVGEEEFILCVGAVGIDAQKMPTEMALKGGHEFFEALKAQGARISTTEKWDNQDFIREFRWNGKDYALHKETYAGPVQWLMTLGATGREDKLGKLAGQLYKASQKLPEQTRENLEIMTNCTTLLWWEQGMKNITAHLRAQQSGAFGAAAQGAENSLEQAYNGLFSAEKQERILNIARKLKNSGKTRVATAFNVIEKTIWEDKEGALILACCDTPSRGFLPLMVEEKNVALSYDFGHMINRMMLSGDNDQGVLTSLRTFVTAYNAETGQSATLEQALEAAENAAAFFSLPVTHGLDARTAPEVETHFRTTLTDFATRTDKLERLRGLSQSTAPAPAPQ